MLTSILMSDALFRPTSRADTAGLLPEITELVKLSGVYKPEEEWNGFNVLQTGAPWGLTDAFARRDWLIGIRSVAQKPAGLRAWILDW